MSKYLNQLPIRKDQLEALREFYDGLLDLEPKNKLLYHKRGEVKLQLSDFDGASLDFKIALHLNTGEHLE